MKLWIVIINICATLTLFACAGTSQDEVAKAHAEQDLADTTTWNARSDIELRIVDNRKVGLVQGIDSLLCIHLFGAEGRVYVDEPLWVNLNSTQRISLGQCLDRKRNLTISTLDAGAKGVKVWTARLSDDERRLLIGTVLSDCITCTLHEGMVEYALTPKDSVLQARRITEEEMWR